MLSTHSRLLVCASLCTLQLAAQSVLGQDRAGPQPPTPIPHATSTADAGSLRLDLASALMRDVDRPADPAQPFDWSRVDFCACGCGVFEVGTGSMLPHGQGGTAWLELDFQDQSRNWSGTSSAPAENNVDKDLRTYFFTAGFQYMFNNSWGVEAEIPFAFRHFEAANEDGGTGTANWGDIADIRIRGIYTGFFDDMSAGLTFGVKLPTGEFKKTSGAVDIDRDTQIGSGSTDVLLGGFFRHTFSESREWTWFAQVNADLPVLIQNHYRPGYEFDEALGIYYSGWSFHGVDIIPIAQVIAAQRTSDGGENSASPVASGYERIFLSPGIEVNLHPIMLYADVEIPVYQHMVGNQLVAPVLVKFIVSYSF